MKVTAMSKAQRNKDKKPFELRNPIYNQSPEDVVRKPRVQHNNKRREQYDEDEQKKAYVPQQLSKKLLQQAREQQLEESEDRKTKGSGDQRSASSLIDELTANQIEHNLEKHGKKYDESDEEEEIEEYEQEEIEEIEISPEDEAALAMFMSARSDFSSTAENQTLDIGSIIMSKIKEKESLLACGRAGNFNLEPKIIQVYSQVATILKKYTSGKIPRAVKIIPLLENWEDVLFLTKPSEWSTQATFALTKIFSASFTEKMAQQFYNLVLLPTVKADILKNKKLNYHYYQALRKASYKPKAFYKGIILPLCESEETTLREAVILGSVIAKCNLSSIISSVALLKISTLPYSGPNSIFVKTIIEKKYALPYRVIDAMVTHFVNFRDEDRLLPVLWHQSLLSFVQRYKEELTPEQKQEIKVLIREKNHPKISPEITRELTHSKCRGESGNMEVI